MVLQDVQLETEIEQVRQVGEHGVQVPLMGIMDVLGHELEQLPFVSTRPAGQDVQLLVVP